MDTKGFDSSELRAMFLPVLAAEKILSSSGDLEFYGRDAGRKYAPNPGIVLLPETRAEVQEILRICSTHRIAVVPSGGRTGYSGGATAVHGEVVLSLSRMRRILEVNIADCSLRCEAGAITEAVQNAASEHGLYFPVDFSSCGSSTIGGNVATNAGGVRVIRYGNIRNWVLGLTVVLPSGEVLELNGALRKNNTGYDLRNLFIASEGTLGVIVEVVLGLTTQPPEYETMLCALESADQALLVLAKLRAARFEVALFEYFERSALEKVTRYTGLPDPCAVSALAYALIQVEQGMRGSAAESVLAPLLECGEVRDVVVAQGGAQAAQLLAYRERIPEVLNAHFVPHKNDISVAVSQFPVFLQRMRDVLGRRYPKNEIEVFGHLGDGNLHLNVLKDAQQEETQFFAVCEEGDRELFALIQQFRGSVSAEHGVGLLKKAHLHHSRAPLEVEIMRAIKRVVDPSGILNPGKIFD